MHYSLRNVSGVTVLIFRPLSNHGLHLYQVSQKYLERFQSYEAYTISTLIITLGHNSVNHGVTVLALCTSSDPSLYLYQVLPKYLERFRSYGANTISILIIT